LSSKADRTEDSDANAAPRSYGEAQSARKDSYSWVWISLLLLILAFTPVIIWAVRKTEDRDGWNEVQFQKLDRETIVGKISSK
jgi:hypothetical protein